MEIEIDPKIRFLVLYRDAEFSIERIHQITKASVRTLRSWRQRLERGENILNVQEGRGRKKKILEFFRKIQKTVVANPQRASLRASGAKFGLSKTTTGRVFHELGFSHKKVKVKHKLTKEEKNDRVKFCQELLENPDEISESFWADESGLWLSDATKKKIWTLEENVVSSPPVQDVKLNMWAAISSKGATTLYIYKQNFDGTVYCRILEEMRSQMKKLLPRGFYYFHDKHPVHDSIVVEECAKRNNIMLNRLSKQIKRP